MNDIDIRLSDLTGRARIRHTALHLFATCGYAHTSLRTIARKATVSLALISHHFGCKHQLRDAVDAWILAVFEKAIRDAAIDTENLSDQAVCQSITTAVGEVVGSQLEIRSYLRRAMVIDGSPNGATLLHSLLTLIRTALREAQPLRSDKDLTWQSLQILLLTMGPALLEPILQRCIPGLFAEADTAEQRRANVQMLRFGQTGEVPTFPAAKTSPVRPVRLVAYG